uniref:Reverse transcriptase zinc-binding domain-containing protein n=1 Tax=Chenopodium quinoa TaxID=63459 RepID=A0A803L3S2_CHEQI
MKNRSGYIAWDMVCRRKKEGGLGVRSIEDWNTAALGKHVWAISQKKENLWVRWINAVYIKNQNWLDYQPNADSSCISRMYKDLRPDLTGCNWDKLVWEKWAAPKHKFIGWIAWHNRLMTRDRLLRFGTPTDASCLLCGDMQEDHEHLFFKCKYSQMIWKEISNRLDTGINLVNLASARRGIRRVKKDFCRRVLHMCILGCIYQI